MFSCFFIVGHKDIVAFIVIDLRAALAAKPGGSSVSAVASGLFRGLPGGVKTTIDESKGQWAVDTEKFIRDSLLQFFVYIFADIKEFLSPDGPNKSQFHHSSFMTKRTSPAVSDSKSLIDFLGDFVKTKMFVRFCDNQRLEDASSKEVKSDNGWSKGKRLGSFGERRGSIVSDEEDDFHAVCSDLRHRQWATTVTNVRAAVISRHAATAAAFNMDGNSNKGFIAMEYHPLTLQYTSGQKGDGNGNSSSEHGSGNGVDMTTEASTGAGQQIIDKICSESHNSDSFSKIMHTIKIRLENCKAANCRGPGGISGLRALNLLRALLLSGPDCVLSASLDYIPVIQIMLAIGGGGGGGGGDPASGSAGSFGPLAGDIRTPALNVLSLLLDHKKLLHQVFYRLYLVILVRLLYLNNKDESS